MRMRCHLRFQQRHGIRAARFAEVMERKAGTLTWMHWSASLHIRKREVRFTVTPVGGAKQREERGVLRNGHHLAVTERPSFGCEVKWENADLSNKRVCHKILCL